MTARLAFIRQQPRQGCFGKPLPFRHLAGLLQGVQQPLGVKGSHCIVIFRGYHHSDYTPATGHPHGGLLGTVDKFGEPGLGFVGG